MVIITFDDAVNSENWDLYNNKLFIPERYFKLESFRKKNKQKNSLVIYACLLFIFTVKIPMDARSTLHFTFLTSTTITSTFKSSGTRAMKLLLIQSRNKSNEI